MHSCARFIYGKRKFEHISPHLRELGWLPVSLRRKYFLGLFIFKLIRNHMPAYLYDMFPIRQTTESSLKIRRQVYFYFPPHKSYVYGKSFVVSAIKLWHSLPTNLTQVKSLESFKYKYWKYLYKTLSL